MDAGNSSLCLLSSWVALGCLGDTSKLQIVGNQAAMFPDKGHRIKQCTPVNTKQRSQTFFNRAPFSFMSAVCSVGTLGSVLPCSALSSVNKRSFPWLPWTLFFSLLAYPLSSAETGLQQSRQRLRVSKSERKIVD